MDTLTWSEENANFPIGLTMFKANFSLWSWIITSGREFDEFGLNRSHGQLEIKPISNKIFIKEKIAWLASNNVENIRKKNVFQIPHHWKKNQLHRLNIGIAFSSTKIVVLYRVRCEIIDTLTISSNQYN